MLQICIRNRAGNDVANVYVDLLDFFDESKYLVTTRDDGNGWLTKKFAFKFEDSISLNEITVDKGYIFYTISILNKDNQLVSDFGLFNAISTGGLYFEKIGKQLNFSLYEEVYKIKERYKSPDEKSSRYAFNGEIAEENIRTRFRNTRIRDTYCKKGMASPVLFSKN